MLDRFTIYRCDNCWTYHVTQEGVEHAAGCRRDTLSRLIVAPVRAESLDGSQVLDVADLKRHIARRFRT